MTSNTYISKYTAWLLLCFFCSVFLITLGASAQEIKLRPINKTTARVQKNETCSDQAKPTKYLVRKGDHIAAILRTLQLEPVFGKNNSLDQLLKINTLSDPNLIEPGQELVIPFDCNEQVSIWQIEDRGTDRLLVRKKDSFITTEHKEIKPGAKIESTSEIIEEVPTAVMTIKSTTEKIIDKNKPIND